MSFKFPIIHTKYGHVKGLLKTTEAGKDYLSFQNIPYVKQPVGELRFRDPQPLEPWTGVFDATKEGPAVPSLNFLAIPPAFIGDEQHCLTLNVFTPNHAPLKPLPVYVYIHGGAFITGSSTTALFGPDYLVEKDVVVVTFNYRIGVYGFLSLKDPKAGVPGNAGLKDQTMALRWVKDNIKSFGGDPNNITLAGESAGGGSVHFHLVSELSKGLFNRAISQSGIATSLLALTPPKVPNFALKLAQSLGYSGGDNDIEVVKYLEQQQSDAVVAQSFQVVDRELSIAVGLDLLCPFIPTIEPYIGESCFLPEHPVQLGRNAWGNNIDLIIGGCANEGYPFGVCAVEDRVEAIKKRPELLIPYEVRVVSKPSQDKVQAFKKLYFGDREPSTDDLEEFTNFYGDLLFWHGIHRLVVQRVQSGAKGRTYVFRLDTETSHVNVFSQLVRKLGNISHLRNTSHGEDVGLIFKSALNERNNPSHSFYTTFQRFLGAFTKFARDGNPNDFSLAPLKWEPASRSNLLACLNMGEKEWSLVEFPKKEVVDLWDSVYTKVDLI